MRARTMRANAIRRLSVICWPSHSAVGPHRPNMPSPPLGLLLLVLVLARTPNTATGTALAIGSGDAPANATGDCASGFARSGDAPGAACAPVCRTPCAANRRCAAPDRCDCTEGFVPIPIGALCRLVCSPVCRAHEVCVRPTPGCEATGRRLTTTTTTTLLASTSATTDGPAQLMDATRSSPDTM